MRSVAQRLHSTWTICPVLVSATVANSAPAECSILLRHLPRCVPLRLRGWDAAAPALTARSSSCGNRRGSESSYRETGCDSRRRKAAAAGPPGRRRAAGPPDRRAAAGRSVKFLTGRWKRTRLPNRFASLRMHERASQTDVTLHPSVSHIETKSGAFASQSSASGSIRPRRKSASARSLGTGSL
jgi:hypothetical protein